MNRQILRIALPVPLNRYFDYLAPPGYKPAEIAALPAGLRIRVPFRKKKMIGILMETDTESSVEEKRLLPAEEILDRKPLLPESLLKLCCKAAEYYHYPAGQVLQLTLPTQWRKPSPPKSKAKTGQTKEPAMASAVSRQSSTLTVASTDNIPRLNNEQRQVIEEIGAHLHSYASFLLEGITGSGKTEVYLQLIEKLAGKGYQTLLLVPEINLTHQLIKLLQDRFAQQPAVLHSGLTPRQRLQSWQRAASGEAKLVVGTRSAIFVPLAHPGIVIVDEEHDNSFSQQDNFRYCARDLAVLRAKIEKIPVVLGSATPSLETLNNVDNGRYRHCQLTSRVGSAQLPDLQLVDIRGLALDGGLASTVIQQTGAEVEAGNQVLLFLNRRGYAPLWQCRECGWPAQCPDCDARLVYHHLPRPRLVCHYCGHKQFPDPTCSECGSSAMTTMGTGTQRCEEVIADHFPDLPLYRVDHDTATKSYINKVLTAFQRGDPGIIIGTQMIAKGHHFPNLTLAAVLEADNGLFSPDFRAPERLAQLLIQVSGRAGRSHHKPGRVLLQTALPEHPLFKFLMKNNYRDFALQQLQERRMRELPPYSHMALLRADARLATRAQDWLLSIRNQLSEKYAAPDISIIGPLPSLLSKREGLFRYTLAIYGKDRPGLHRVLTAVDRIIERTPPGRYCSWSLDIDPSEL